MTMHEKVTMDCKQLSKRFLYEITFMRICKAELPTNSV